MSCVVVIPIYKYEPDAVEAASLEQCINVLKKYDICLIKPEHLDIRQYKRIFENVNKKFTVQSFNDDYFRSVRGYSELCLTMELYTRFRQYDYMFLYQLDGWVFRDELDYWCNQQYDYIGAPWFEKFDEADKKAALIVPSGNGGVSLRKIETFIKILKQIDKEFAAYGKITTIRILAKSWNEDVIIVRHFSTIYPAFKIAEPNIAMRFSFEINPEILYAKINKLPFACHAFLKYSHDFWKDHIDLPGVRWLECKQAAVNQNGANTLNYIYDGKYRMKTAVLLLTFNRLDYLKEVFAAVAKAKPPRLYIASDGPRPEKVGEKEQINKIRKYLLSHIDWDCEVKTRFLEQHSGGCGKGVSGAVTWFFENEPEGIILEDDCVPDLSFFAFCELMLEKYRDDKRIWHISGDGMIDTATDESYWFSKIMHCWGWASWRDRWQYFSLDMSQYRVNLANILARFSENKNVQAYWQRIYDRTCSGEIDTWDYQWIFHIMAHGGLCINPAHCLVSNIGDSGVHYKNGAKELHHQVVPLTEIVHPTEIKPLAGYEYLMYKERYNIGMGKPTVSVITICYNIKDEIERTCRSIINQTWQDFEWIVVDGGSTDGTLEVLQKYKNRINVLISEPDKGVYNAMNKGIKHASGEWLNFMNGGDCFAANDVLEKVFKNKEYDAGVIYGNRNLYCETKCLGTNTYPENVDADYFYNNCLNHQSTFNRAELFTQYGMYNEKNKIISDIEANVIWAKNKVKFQKVDVVVADFYDGGINNNRVLYNLEHQKMIRKYYKNKRPTVSVITICYNIKDEIERTCRSIINQTWKDFEWIVVDGGSTDGTLEILQKYKKWMHVLISEPDKGVYNAMNKGIKHARGEWLNFMNGGDCFADGNALWRVFKDKQHQKNILQGQEERYDIKGKIAHIWRFPTIDKHFFLRNSMAHQSAFYRRKLFKKYGGYDESYKYCADTELNLRFVAAGEEVEMMPFIVGKFWLTGLSNKPEIADIRYQEHVTFNNKYFTPEELAIYPSRYKNTETSLYPQSVIEIISYRLFNFIPLLRLERK